MSKVRVDDFAAFPEALKWQAVSFMRVEWPFIYSGRNRFGKHTYPPQWHPVHFSIVEEDVLISHAEVIQIPLEHRGETYRLSGLGNVFTFPSFRRKGYGKQVVQAATKYILDTDTDIGMLFCRVHLAPFYAASGWEALGGTLTRIGTASNYRSHKLLRMMLFVSEKGENGQSAFTKQPLYLEHEW